VSDEQIKVLRPGDCYLAGHTLPDRVAPQSKAKSVVTPEFIRAYNATPSSEVRRRYAADPEFAALVDEMLRQGEPNVL
jgi:hypothetical protein